jgi:hypothetical protein
MSARKSDLAPLRLAVKYCGGCNPDYDRGDLVEKMCNLLSQKVLMVDPEEDPDVVIAVQGCATACADLSPFDESKILQIKNKEDLQPLIEKLQRKLP